MTSDTLHCDESSHPWAIIGKPGQRFELTLYDFAGSLYGAGSSPAEDFPPEKQTTGPRVVCLTYGLIEDSAREKPISICGDTNRRVSTIYRSTGNVVKVWITAVGSTIPEHYRRFLIHFSGRLNARLHGRKYMYLCPYVVRQGWHPCRCYLANYTNTFKLLLSLSLLVADNEKQTGRQTNREIGKHLKGN